MSNDNIRRMPIVGEVWYFPNTPVGISVWNQAIVKFTRIENVAVWGDCLNKPIPDFSKHSWLWDNDAFIDYGAILIPQEIVNNPESLKLHIALLTGNVTDES